MIFVNLFTSLDCTEAPNLENEEIEFSDLKSGFHLSDSVIHFHYFDTLVQFWEDNNTSLSDQEVCRTAVAKCVLEPSEGEVSKNIV